jgi:hypothetical protein
MSMVRIAGYPAMAVGIFLSILLGSTVLFCPVVSCTVCYICLSFCGIPMERYPNNDGGS